MKSKYQHLCINEEYTLIDVLKKMDEERRKLLILLENSKYKNLISIGDIQRALIKGSPVNTKVSEIEIGQKVVCHESEDRLKTIETLKQLRAEFMPIVSSEGDVEDILFWDDVISSKRVTGESLKGVPIVLMAGGLGTRLRPITNVIPKPLIPLGQLPIIHQIINRFCDFGATDFKLSVNYKWKMIKNYFDSEDRVFDLEYFVEKQPLGTAGSLSLMRDQLDKTFVISNCDIIIEENYETVFDYHKRNKNDITIVACIKSYDVPYGVIETDQNGLYDSLIEKPTFTYKLNTGMYILEPNLVDLVPENTFFHITHLIEKAKETGKKVGVFPISEKSWIDIGEWKSYLASFEQMEKETN